MTNITKVTSNSPILPRSINRASEHEVRIRDLEQITDENVNLSMFFAVDLVEKTFKMNLEQMLDYFKLKLINEMYLVGDLIITTLDITPKTRGLTGTWTYVAIDTTLINVLDPELGIITGENNPAVPLLNHVHQATAKSTTTSTFKGNKLPIHLHNVTVFNANGFENDISGASGGAYTSNRNTSGTSAGTPSGPVTSTTKTSVDIVSAGIIDPRINVRGKYLGVRTWIKTAM